MDRTERFYKIDQSINGREAAMKHDRDQPAASNNFQAAQAMLIAASYRQLTGRELLPAAGETTDFARRLYHAPFVVLAHDAASDPVFFYANLTAQQLFEMTWFELVCLPSRYSAEPLARDERQRLLDRVASQGYIDDYAGIRISASGKRFHVTDATVWNLIDTDGQNVGQAASFSTWAPLKNSPAPAK